MINLHKYNSPRARYEAGYLSWLRFVFINMLTGWMLNIDAIKNLVVLVGISILILLMPVSLPVFSLIAMISERREFVRRWGKTAPKSEEK